MNFLDTPITTVRTWIEGFSNGYPFGRGGPWWGVPCLAAVLLVVTVFVAALVLWLKELRARRRSRRRVPSVRVLRLVPRDKARRL